MLSNIFIISGSLFALTVLLGKLFVFKNKNIMMVSNYIALIAALLGLYSILGLVLAFYANSNLLRVIMILFAVMPFVLGQLANYHTEKFYTTLQIVLVTVSVGVCRLYF